MVTSLSQVWLEPILSDFKVHAFVTMLNCLPYLGWPNQSWVMGVFLALKLKIWHTVKSPHPRQHGWCVTRPHPEAPGIRLGTASLTLLASLVPIRNRVFPCVASSPIPDTCLIASFLPVQSSVPSTSGLFHFGDAQSTTGCYWHWNSLPLPQ